MPIFYPPEYIQAQVSGPNPTPNLGGAFDALAKMANTRQASAQDLLQMLLQSVPETGGARATVAGQIANQPETISALTPGRARLFPKRGQPTEHQTVTAGFTKAMATLPQRPNVDVGQFQTALKNRMEQSQVYRQASGKTLSPEVINKMAYNDAQALPNTAESLGLKPDEFADYVTASKPENITSVAPIIIKHYLAANPNATEKDLFALGEKISMMEKRGDPAISQLTELIKQMTLETMRANLPVAQNRALEIKAGQEATQEERTKAEASVKRNMAVISGLNGAMPLMDAALKGDKAAALKLGMMLGQVAAASGEAGLFGYASSANMGTFTEADRNDLKSLLELAKSSLAAAQETLKTRRIPPASGASAGPAVGPAPLSPELEEFFKTLEQSGIDPSTLLGEPSPTPTPAP